jgi:hypothetical protein
MLSAGLSAPISAGSHERRFVVGLATSLLRSFAMPFSARWLAFWSVPMALTAISTAGLAADGSGAGPITPKAGVIRGLPANEFHGLYTWLKDTSYRDPRGVFSIEDGTLHISGEGLGYIGTKDEYKNYHLVVEFRWGKRIWGSRQRRSRDSGVLLHAVGHDGNFTDQQYRGDYPRSNDGRPSAGEFMTSIEAQVIEGGIGDLLLVQGKDLGGQPIPVSLTAEIRRGNFWKQGEKKSTFTTNARVQWFAHDPAWKDITGFRGQRDVESPLGEWTRMDVLCDGGHIVIRVNGVVVNEATEALPSAGKILIQCELSELYVRRWELWPLDKEM